MCASSSSARRAIRLRRGGVEKVGKVEKLRKSEKLERLRKAV